MPAAALVRRQAVLAAPGAPRGAFDTAPRGLVTVLDVRPPKESAAGHLPGAIDIPIRELEQRLAELPRRREVVAYCRGPDCLMSCDAVRLLRRKGLKAGRRQGGLPEWRLAGLPTVRDENLSRNPRRGL